MAVSAAIMFTGCTNWEKIREEVAEKNKKAFEEVFHNQIDPEQDWNVVENSYVNVSVGQPSDIRIYAFDGKRNTMVANYKGVSGSQKLTFDNLKGIKQVYVANMTQRKAIVADLNGSADFAGSKNAVRYEDDEISIEPILDWTPSTLRITLEDLQNNPVCEKDYMNIAYYAFQDFKLTPLFWDQLFGEVQIGVFYYDADGNRKEHIVYNRMQNASEPGGFYKYLAWGMFQELYDNGYPAWLRDEDKLADDNIKSRTIHVTMAEPGQQFGFFIQTQHISGRPMKIFSDHAENEIELQKVLNGEGIYAGADSYFKDRAKDFLAGSCCVLTKVGDRHYLRFECYNQDSRNYDSMVFAIDDTRIVPVWDVPSSWTLAIEDMGTINDYDFNDVVLSVAHAAGETTATVKFLAIGCTIENWIYYNDQKLGEAHEIFGEKDMKKVINTRTKTAQPVVMTINVPADFSLSVDGSTEGIGGFRISNQFNSGTRLQEIGSVPYMICVPGDWRWPLENVNINVGYNSFNDWVGDHSKAGEWFKTISNPEAVIEE